jgi:cellulose synthase/poly-beta-1,6-N-acetylglucosamine synthase-like glycosyltransferase
MLIYLVVIFGIYFGFLLICIVGWMKFRSSIITSCELKKRKVSVIIPFRNEEESIQNLLDSVKVQDYSVSDFEILFIDDNSTDSSPALVQKWINNNSNFKSYYLLSDDDGKKKAITIGVKHASGEIILTTDGDCILPSNWISSMISSFDMETKMVAGLVKIEASQSFFSKIQSLEFSTVLGTGIAFQKLGYPIYCNGASLAYLKNAFEEVKGYEGNEDIPSGDDEFLMRKFKKAFPNSIIEVKYLSVVGTRPQSSVKSFLNQRVRWAGKWKLNNSYLYKSLAVFILIFQFIFLGSLSLLLLNDLKISISILIGVKVLIDLVFIFMVSNTLNQRFYVFPFLSLQLVYPFYVILIGLLSQFVNYEWKGRTQSVR